MGLEESEWVLTEIGLEGGEEEKKISFSLKAGWDLLGKRIAQGGFILLQHAHKWVIVICAWLSRLRWELLWG